MLDFIPNSVCMDNGSETAKKHAKYLTSDIKDDGVLKGLINLGLIDAD